MNIGSLISDCAHSTFKEYRQNEKNCDKTREVWGCRSLPTDAFSLRSGFNRCLPMTRVVMSCNSLFTLVFRSLIPNSSVSVVQSSSVTFYIVFNDSCVKANCAPFAAPLFSVKRPGCKTRRPQCRSTDNHVPVLHSASSNHWMLLNQSRSHQGDSRKIICY